MKPTTYYLFVLLFLCCNSCSKNDNIFTNNIEFYLLASYSDNNCQIDESTIKLQKEPLVIYDDIISYDSNSYSFKITDDAKEKINNINYSTQGTAFAVVANNKLIYSGYFIPSYSSSGCDWVAIDPLEVNLYNEMIVKLGYPGQTQGVFIPDKRNDKTIIKILAKDNKLIE